MAPAKKKSKSILTISEALNNVQKGTIKISNVTFTKTMVRSTSSPQQSQHSLLSSFRHI